MRDKIAQTLGKLIRDKLSDGKSVHIRGLGRFSVAHKQFTESSHPDGSVLIHPPSNKVEFEKDDA